MKTISKLKCLVLTFFTAAILAGCEVGNDPETEEIVFSVSWENGLDTDIEVRMDAAPTDGVKFMPVDTQLRAGGKITIASVRKSVTVDDASTLAAQEEEALAAMLSAIKSIEMRYFSGNAMYSYSADGESLLKSASEYGEADGVKTLSLTADLLERAGAEKREGQEARASLYWRNDYTQPVGASIEAEGYAAVETELQPGDSVKIADLRYYTFADDEKLSGEMLRRAMAAYHTAIGKALLDLPDMPDAVDGSVYNMGDVSGAVKTLFDITAYTECVEGTFTLRLYNRMLYFDLICELDSENGWEKTERRVIWENGTDEPMTIDLTYVEDKIYTLGGDVHCTLQPGETLELSTFAIYSSDNPSFRAWIDSCWDFYTGEIESLRITCGEKIYDMDSDGRGAFIKSYNNYEVTEEGYVFTFTEESFGGGE